MALTLLAAGAVLIGFIIPVLLVIRYQDYRQPQDLFVSTDQLPPKIIQDSSIIYAIGLTSVAVFLPLGIRGDFAPALIHAMFLGLGVSLIYLLRAPILNFMARALTCDHSITVHEFIAQRHGNDPRVRIVAAGLTLCAMAGLIGCQMVGAATVLKPLLFGSESLTYLFIGAFLIVTIFSSISAGHAGIMRAAQLQLGLLYLALFAAMTLLMYLQISELGVVPARGAFAMAMRKSGWSVGAGTRSTTTSAARKSRRARTTGRSTA